MKKWAFALVVILAIAGAGIYFLAANANELVRQIIEVEGSKATKSHISIGTINLRPTEGKGEITELNIFNPEGFSQNNAIEIGTISTTLNLNSLKGDSPIVISDVTLDGTMINYEIRTDARNNLQTLEGNTHTAAASEQGETTHGRKVIIEMVTITPTIVNIVQSPLDKARTITLPEIQLRNIGLDSDGANANEILHQILSKLTKETVQAVSSEMIRELGPVKALESGGMGELEGNLKQALDKLKQQP